MNGVLRPSFVLPGRVQPGRLDLLLDIAEHLDAVPGWYGAWVPDTLLALRFYESTVLLAALASRTRRLRLGVACMSTLGLRQPLVVAQQWATLDVLSGGRVTLVACPGNRTGTKHERERAAFGLSFEEKTDRMLDALRLLRLASSSEVFSYRSPFLDLADVELVPGFVQRPLPIWMTANPTADASTDGLRRVLGRVAEHGDGWLTFDVRPEQLAARRELLLTLRAERGLPPETYFPIAVQVNVTLADTAAEAEADARAAWQVSATRGIDLERLHQVSAIGTARHCAAFLGELHAAGATDVLLHPLSADPRAQAERASRDLLPLLPGAVAARASVEALR